MKRLLNIIFFTSLIFYGLSFLVFVLRMMWFPPTMMGMMMGRQMIYNHMLYWFIQTFFISIIIAGIIILVWVVKEAKKYEGLRLMERRRDLYSRFNKYFKRKKG